MRRVLVVLAFGVLVLGSLVVLTRQPPGSPEMCRLRADVTGERVDVRLTPAQVDNAEVIAAVGADAGMSRQAVVVALATAQQESRLRNLPYGDRDSLGLFQQRPSQGWGTPEQVLDPVYASQKFYEELDEVPGWEEMQLTEAAQTVQRSAFPDAYAQWEPMAEALAAAVSGDRPETLTCDVSEGVTEAAEPAAQEWEPEPMGDDGLTPRARQVREVLWDTFEVALGGYCPGGCHSARADGSDHQTGTAVDVTLTPSTQANRSTGDQIAEYLVANAERLAVKHVIWDGRIWSQTRADEGWREYAHPEGDLGNLPSMAHEHLHVSVY